MVSFPNLIKRGLTPNLNDLNTFLLFLSQTQRFKTIISIFSQLTSNNLITPNATTRTIFTKALLKDHKYDQAADFLKPLIKKSEIFDRNRIFDCLIQGLCTFDRNPEKGLSLLKCFLQNGSVFPSSRTFCLLIHCFSSLGKMDSVVELLELMSDDKFDYPFHNYICSSVVSGFVRIGEPELAVAFYENAVNSCSLRPSSVTCTAAMTAYVKLRDVEKVSGLVAWMEKNKLGFDVVFYSSWMYGCFKDGLVEEVFRRVRTVVDRKLELDTIWYTILIDGFSKQGYVEKAAGFLYKMRKDGIVPNLVTYTSIILGFCNKGKLDEAFAIFAMLDTLGIEVDEFTYAVLIHAVCRRGNFDSAFQLLGEMEKKGIHPGIVTYNTIINGLCKAGRTSEATGISEGIIRDVFTYSTLLHGYVEEHNETGILETKSRLEADKIRMDIIMCNTLIKALLMVGLFEDALEIYKRLPQMNLFANSVTYFTLIDGYCKAGRINDALEIFDDFRKTSITSAACYDCIISGLCSMGMIDMAVDVFSEYVKESLLLDRTMYMNLIKITYDSKGPEGILNVIYRMEHLGIQELDTICNQVISFLCEMHHAEASCDVLSLMIRKGLGLTSTCYYSTLTGLLCAGKKLLALVVLTPFLKAFGMSDTRVHKILLHYLCLSDVERALVYISKVKDMNEGAVGIPITVFTTLTNTGRVLDAYELLIGAGNDLPDMNVVIYSIMIDALCKGTYIDKALDVCSYARRMGTSLNIVTYNSVINGLCHQGCLVEAFRLFDSLEKIGVFPSEITYGTLIDALVKEGLLVDARILFDRMLLKDLRPTTHIYNSLINGHCKASLLEEAVKLFQDLELRNLEADEFTAAALINGYCHKGDMEGALGLFLEFKSKGLYPDFLGFLFLIRGLCAKGRMEESRSILREMIQTKSVLELLGRINSEAESDSVENLLIFLCDQGKIHEAITVLDEVWNMLFTAARNTCYGKSGPVELEVDADCFAEFPDVELAEEELRNHDCKNGKRQQFTDFDSFWNAINSLCQKGDITKANRLAKLVIDS